MNVSMHSENRAMSSVFIANIANDITEEQLKALFSEVGQVLNFRVIADKSLNKSKLAFAEYKDPETAVRAIRSLSGYELKGQPIHVDLATSEKCRQELERLQGNIEASADIAGADKAPEEISKAVASLPAEQMFELMKQMKMCVENNPQEARNLLLQNPQLAYALLQAQVIMRIVDPEVAIKILNRPTAPPTDLDGESKNETTTAVPPASDVPSELSTGIATVTSDPVAVNTSAPMPQQHLSLAQGVIPGPVPSVRQPRMPMMPGVPNQFADQDLRIAVDQDLRTLPNLVDVQPPPVMLGIDKDMRQPMGDHDFRTLGVPTTNSENRPFDPRFRNMQGAERNVIPSFERPRPSNVDPRTVYDPRNPGAPSRVEDPRKADPRNMAANNLNSRLSAAGPALQNLGPNMAAGAAAMISEEQEKAALIMQVLQLTDQQIAALPPEQRQSILVLKEQLRNQIT